MKKLCSAVCALLAFSGNRGGALTKEILCNAGQWLACLFNGMENIVIFDAFGKKLVPVKISVPILTPGKKAFSYAIGATTIANAVDAAKRSYDIARDVIKDLNNKPDTTNKKESKNYWPILEAIFGVSQFAYAFGHRPILNAECNGVCKSGLVTFVVGLASFTDAYFRYRESNQSNESQIQKKEEATQPNQTLSNPENSKDSSSDKK